MARTNQSGRILPPAELSGFCAQIAMMLSSGLALYDGVEALARSHRGSAAGELYEAVSRGVTETGSLHEALKADGRWPNYLVEMTAVGERTGRLEEIMDGLARYYDREGRIRRAIAGAVTYPMVLGGMMLLIVVAMLTLVLPVFRRVLANMGFEAAAGGGGLMEAGAAIGWAVLVLVGAALAGAAACCILLRTGAREKVLAFVRRLFPAANKISYRLAASRVASVLSIMLSGGFPLDEALEMTPSVLDDEVAKREIGDVRDRIENGCPFEEAVTQTKLFDEVYNCMIRLGCEVGRTDSVMERIARDYEEQVEDSVARLVSIIEPTLVAALSVIIGAMLLSVMLPMAGVISSIL